MPFQFTPNLMYIASTSYLKKKIIEQAKLSKLNIYGVKSFYVKIIIFICSGCYSKYHRLICEQQKLLITPRGGNFSIKVSVDVA